MKSFLSFILTTLLLSPGILPAATPDSIYKDNIQTVRLSAPGNQLAMPIIHLGTNEQLQLDFDDLDADVKNYYFSLQLCNYDWTPSDVMPMQYLSGFSQTRITSYRFSSVALTRYTHYQVMLPQGNSRPKMSGNYMVMVYLNGDTSQLAFTKRLLVLDSKSVIKGNVTQPNSARYFDKFQKLVFNINVNNINGINAQQQVRVTLLKNSQWNLAMQDVKPTFIRGNSLEFNSESTGIFPAGREWRWLDLRDFQLQTDRVATADYNKNSTDIFLRPDRSLASQPYLYYPDLDGLSLIQAVRGINPDFEGDYATVYFYYYPPDGIVMRDNELYLYGQLTNYSFSDSIKMKYNPETNLYETHLYLKQGYYDYTYLARNIRNPQQVSEPDGDIFDTENDYTILVYYRPFGARTDELIGISQINSRPDKKGSAF